MKKSEAYTQSRAMIEDLRDHMLRTGLNPDKFMIREEWDEIKAPFFIEAYKYIKRIYDEHYPQLKYIRGLLSEELWERYAKWGDFDDHQECILYRDALVKLKKAFMTKGKPLLFLKGKRDGELRKISKRKHEKEQAHT